MQRHLVRDGLRFKLAQRYQENPRHFLSLSKQAVDSALAREIVAELRNEGHVEEEVRGTIRLTPRGYRAFQNGPPPYSYRN
jgi:predicted transcriptional regulator